MKIHKLTLSGLLLATSALVAPGVAFAQSTAPVTPAQTNPTQQTPAERAQAEDPVTEVEEIVVLGRFIPQPNRESPEVAAFLTSEDLERTGDSNAAEALTRVTGLSIVEGRFIYVRGLGERYSSALLNGSPLPSPEPLQRVVPLDLFPADILSGVTVQKTYSANYPGEFGGGVIDMQTVGAPRENFFSMSASVGGNTETSGKEGLTYYGSQTDWTGFDDGTRDLPGRLASAFNSGLRIQAGPNYSANELRAIGQSLVNAPLRLLQRDDIPANFGVGITGGVTSDTGYGDLGLVFVAGFDNSWRLRDGIRQSGRIDGGELVVADDYRFESNQNDVGLNFLGSISLEADDYEIKWTNLYVRNTTKEARSQVGFNEAAGGVQRDDYTEWFERELFSSQLAGEQYFGGNNEWKFSWRAAYATTSRDAPYETQIAYGQRPDGVFQHTVSRSRISFSELSDDVISSGAEIGYTLPLSEIREAVFTFGIASYDNERSSEKRDLQFIQTSSLTTVELQELLESRVDYLFSDYNIGRHFQIQEVTGSQGDAAYDAKLKVGAAFLNVEAEIIPLINLTAGVRFESGEQSVTPYSPILGGSTQFARTTIEEDYFLPAATATWNFAEDMQLRFAASKTIGRPQFRELAPQSYRDVESDRTFIGNPYLVDTELLNLDARYEWYFARQQYVTAGVFYKDLDKPIEAYVADQGSNISQTFINAPKAVLMGIEFEAKKYFEFADSGSSFIANKRWLVQGNYTFTDSEVKVGDDDTVIRQEDLGVPQLASNIIRDGSRLQGQSEHVATLQMGWEDDTDRSQATLIANFVSERSSARGRPGEPDFIQEPGVMLDFVYRQDFDLWGQELGLSVELRNLLNEKFQEYQELDSNSVTINGYDLGTSGSVSLTAKF